MIYIQIVIGVVIVFLLGPVFIAMTIDGFSAAWEMWRDLARRPPTS